MENRDGDYDLNHAGGLYDDEIDLVELFRVMWRKKLIIVICTAIFACISFLMISNKFLAPSVSTVSQDFSLKFTGIENNKYPNGLDFSIAEITSPQILDVVCQSNQLKQYNQNPQILRDNLVVSKSVVGLLPLEEKYNALLAQKGLTVEERQLLQDEYQKQRLKLFQSPYYTITWVDKTGQVPTIIQEKVLFDILHQWAINAETQKGVFLYQVPIITNDAFYFENVDEEYIVKVDMLRHVVSKIKDNLIQIQKLPGALLAVTSSGNKLTSLQLRVNDLLNYQIAPLTGLIRSGGLHVNKQLALIYTREQLYNLELEKGVLEGEMALLSDALDGYINSNDQLIARRQTDRNQTKLNSTIIPQIGDRFLDQLVALANDNQDVGYRQDITTKIVKVGTVLLGVEKDITYYKELLKSRQGGNAKSGVLLEAFKQKNKRAITEAKEITTEMTELYQLISQSYLTVSENLYQLEGPIQQRSTRVVSLKKIGLIYGASLFVFFCLCCFTVLLVTSFRKKQ